MSKNEALERIGPATNIVEAREDLRLSFDPAAMGRMEQLMRFVARAVAREVMGEGRPIHTADRLPQASPHIIDCPCGYSWPVGTPSCRKCGRRLTPPPSDTSGSQSGNREEDPPFVYDGPAAMEADAGAREVMGEGRDQQGDYAAQALTDPPPSDTPGSQSVDKGEDVQEALAIISEARVVRNDGTGEFKHASTTVYWAICVVETAIRTAERERDGAVFDYKQADERAAKAEAALATLRVQVERAREVLKLAVLDADVCVAECVRCSHPEPITDWDISRHVREAYALLDPVPGKGEEAP